MSMLVNTAGRTAVAALLALAACSRATTTGGDPGTMEPGANGAGVTAEGASRGAGTGGTDVTTRTPGTPEAGLPANPADRGEVAAVPGVAGTANSPTSPTAGASGAVTESGGAVASSSMGRDMFADPNIAAVASASNHMEIQTSQLALQRAQSAEVRAFAQRMIDEHSRLEQEAQAMLSSKGMAPVDNSLSLQQKRNLQLALDSLRSRSGADFDMTYMADQVAAHEMTLRTLDTTLIPQASDPQLKSMLQQQVRPAVADHLQRAKALQLSLTQSMPR